MEGVEDVDEVDGIDGIDRDVQVDIGCAIDGMESVIGDKYSLPITRECF
jgi:hypothetical protein